jgi:hypothetical protein
MYGNRIAVPKTLQRKVLKQLHETHAGTNSMKAMARTVAYWPFMDQQLSEITKNCETCRQLERAPTKNSLNSWPMPEKPWQRINIDYASKDGENFLIIVDALSKYPEIILSKTTTATKTISLLDATFAKFGLPETIVSDNGTQFTSQIFEDFCREKGIQHIMTAPYHPNSNGLAERFVQTWKNALNKMKEISTQQALNKFLLSYRTTPNINTSEKTSPAEALFGRPIRSIMNLMQPKTLVPRIRNKKMENQYNRRHGAKEKNLKPKEKVKIRLQHKKGEKWLEGCVIERIGNAMYNVLIDKNNKVVRAHADQLISIETSEWEPSKQQNFQLPYEILMEVFSLPV